MVLKAGSGFDFFFELLFFDSKSYSAARAVKIASNSVVIAYNSMSQLSGSFAES